MLTNKGYDSLLKCRLSDQGGSREYECLQKALKTVLLHIKNFRDLH